MKYNQGRDYGIVDNEGGINWCSQFSDGNGFCYKGGLGIDYFATDNISLGFEGNYVFGTGDVRYANATVGVAYHF